MDNEPWYISIVRLVHIQSQSCDGTSSIEHDILHSLARLAAMVDNCKTSDICRVIYTCTGIKI